MHRITVSSLLVLFAATCLGGTARADIAVGVEFSKDEIRIISEWYQEHGSQSHRGGHGRGNGLPPGIARNLIRGKPLPPGIAKQFLPDSLVRALPAPPPGFERVIIDGKVLLVEIATRVIHDVLADIINH